MNITDYTRLSESELRTMQRRAEHELERRRLTALAEEIASTEPTADDLEYLDLVWYSGGGPVSLREGEGSEQAIRWLWDGTVLAHEAQWERPCTVAHVAGTLATHLEALLLGGGGEDTADLRDLREPPAFGGRGCTCELYDDGGPESGPSLGVEISERCPLHSHLLVVDATDGPDWVSEAGRVEGISTDLARPLDPNTDPEAHRAGCGMYGPCDCDAHERARDVDSGRLTDRGYERPQAYGGEVA